MKYSDFLKKELSIEIKNDELVELALTHPSYANEINTYGKHYERLEFVGDAILQFLTSEFLFKQYPDKKEGYLTVLRAKAVREEALANFASTYQLYDYIKVGKGEEKSGGAFKKSILANVFEAMLGAIYLTNGLDDAKVFVQIVIDACLDNALDDDDAMEDYKSKLQEYIQADTKRSVTYEMVKVEGTANEPVFDFVVKNEELVLGYGRGTSKKRAQQNAAKDALEKLALNKKERN